MQHRELGRSELRVPVVVLGAWAIGGWYWGGTDDAQAIRAIQASIDHGANAIDTAPVYGFGHSETIVGRALVGRRDRAIVMTKVGLRWDTEEGEPYFDTVDTSGTKRVVRRNASAASVRHEVEASLARMGVETIDLIQVHWPDPRTPIAETMGALLELRRAGKVRAIGVSNYSVAQMEEARRALGDVPLASDQPKYNLVARDAEKEILPWCAHERVGTVVYSPLEQGLLTGKVDATRSFSNSDGRHKRPTFASRNRELVNACLRDVVQPIATRHGATIGQVVVAWTVAQPGVTAAIVGARTPEQAIENAAAGDVRLTADELARVRAAFEALRLETPPPAGAPAGASGIRGMLKRLLGGGRS